MRYSPVLALLLLPAGCGGRSTPDLIDAGGCPMPWTFVSQRCQTSFGHCQVGGEDSSGTRYDMTCDGTTCSWKVNGRLACSCSKLDWANVCPNAVPTCAVWTPAASATLPPFNWATMTCVAK